MLGSEHMNCNIVRMGPDNLGTLIVQGCLRQGVSWTMLSFPKKNKNDMQRRAVYSHGEGLAVGRMKADTLGSCWKLCSQIVIAVFFLKPEHWKLKNRKCMEKQVCTDGLVLGLTVYLDS